MAEFGASARRRFRRVGSGAPLCLGYRLPRAVERLPRAPRLGREGAFRLKVLDHAKARSVAATCRRFNIARSTYYRWAGGYDPTDPTTLEDRSARPRRCRRPTWTAAQAEAVRRAREAHPRRGKDKLAGVLRREGTALSVSMVGRILAAPHAVRTPKAYAAEAPGDLVEVDTMHLTPPPGVERRQFTAVDVVSRWGAVAVRAVATAGTARDFPADLLARAPFPVRAVQAFCAERALPLFVLPPRRPKLNGHVERANRTHRNEFWELYAGELALPPLRAALRAWEDEYNRVRPHQAPGYRTPAAFLAALGEPHL